MLDATKTNGRTLSMYNTDAMGVRIGELRKARGMTQQALAEALGISGQAVSKWESGLGYPDITLLPAIAETLGVSIEVLFGKEPDYPIVPVPAEPQTDSAPQEETVPPAEAERAASGTGPSAEAFSAESIDAALEATLLEAEEAMRSVREREKDAARFGTDTQTEEAEAGEADARTDRGDALHEEDAPFDVRIEATLQAVQEALQSIPDDALRSIPNTVKSALNEARQAVRSAKAEAEQAAGGNQSASGAAAGTQDEPNYIFGAGESVPGIRSLYVKTQGGADINIYKSEDGVCRWEAAGSQEFADKVSVTADGDRLQVITPTRAEMAAQAKRWNLFGIPFSAGMKVRQTNRVDIWLGAAEGESIELNVLGTGDIHCQPSFTSARLTIQGSGDIDCSGAENLTASIAGSGDINFDRADSADLRIAGSGDINAREITQSLKAAIAGHGDINVRQGCLKSLNASIAGSGDLKLDQIEADEVKIKVLGSGDVVIAGGSVRQLTASVSGSGDISMPGVTAKNAFITLHGTAEMTIGAILEPCRLQKDKMATLRILNDK